MSTTTVVTTLGALVCVAAVSTPAAADTIRVPRDFSDMQSAFDAAEPGDRIVLSRTARYPWRAPVLRTSDVVLESRGGLVGGAGIQIVADRVTVRGIDFRGPLVIEGDDVRVTRNRFVGGESTVPGSGDFHLHMLVTTGSGTRVEGNRFGHAYALVDGDDSVFRKNRLDTSGARVCGDRATIFGNRSLFNGRGLYACGDDAVVERNVYRGGSRLNAIDVDGDRAIVRNNRVENQRSLLRRAGSQFTTLLMYNAITVDGADASITRNRARRVSFGIVVTGPGHEIVDNDVAVGWTITANLPGESGPRTLELSEACPAVVIHQGSEGTLLADNQISHQAGSGIVVESDAVRIENNSVESIRARTSIDVTGDQVEIVGNHVRRTEPDVALFPTALVRRGDLVRDGLDNGIVVEGTDCDVVSNTVAGGFGCGLIVHGNDNTVDDMRVSSVENNGVIVVGNGNALTGVKVDAGESYGVQLCGNENSVEDSVVRRTHVGFVVDSACEGTELIDCEITRCDVDMHDWGSGTVVR